jgi:hypothetical protein
MTGAAIASGVVLGQIEEAKPNTKTVVSHRRSSSRGRSHTGDQGIKKAGELHLVKDTPYLFTAHAKDVIHSFWVPQFRMKKDAVPGIVTQVRVEPTTFGIYTLAAQSSCGLGHATMRARIVVERSSASSTAGRRRRERPRHPPHRAREYVRIKKHRSVNQNAQSAPRKMSGLTTETLTPPLVSPPKRTGVRQPPAGAQAGTRAGLDDACRRRLRFRLRGPRYARSTRAGHQGLADRDRDPDRGAALLPRRHRRVRLLGQVHDRASRPSRGPLRPRRTSWKDYFRVNTDHKVIGVQYTVTALFFLLVGGALAEVMRAELAQPGQQIVDSNTFNGLFSVHASLMIFLVIIPIFAGSRTSCSR